MYKSLPDEQEQDLKKNNYVQITKFRNPYQPAIASFLILKQFMTNLAKFLITSVVFDISSDIKVDFLSSHVIIEEFASGCHLKLAFYGKMNFIFYFITKCTFTVRYICIVVSASFN